MCDAYDINARSSDEDIGRRQGFRWRQNYFAESDVKGFLQSWGCP